MTTATRQRTDVWLILLALAATFLAVSNQSFWIDEAITAHFSVQPTLHDWTDMMRTWRGGSDPQMPFYLFWTWLWEKIFGSGEMALRLANWPWLAVGIILFGWRKPAFAAVCALNAFIWYYSDEARPYAMQVGLALCLMRATITLAGERDKPHIFWQIVLIISGTLLATSHLIGMFWTAAYWGFCLLAVPALRQGKTLKRTAAIWFIALGILAVTAYFYLWSIRTGLRATDAGVTDFRNIFYDFYELMGFSGLGPGRLDIRETGLAAFKPFAPQLALAALVGLPLLMLGALMLLRRLGLRRGGLFVLVMAGTTLFILGIGVEKHFRVLARHLTPLLPVVLWMLAAGADRLWHGHRSAGKFVVIAAAGLSLLSCLEIRFAPRQAKDDYRSAASVANAALQKHQLVWWNADNNGAWYYHVSLSEQNIPATNCALRVIYPTTELLNRLPRPDVIICTKADLYDHQNAIPQFTTTNGYHITQTFQAFQVWQK